MVKCGGQAEWAQCHILSTVKVLISTNEALIPLLSTRGLYKVSVWSEGHSMTLCNLGSSATLQLCPITVVVIKQCWYVAVFVKIVVNMINSD